MVDFETSSSKCEVPKSNSWKYTSFSKTMALQREPFLTTFYIINLSPLLVTKKGFMAIIILSNYQQCPLPLRIPFWRIATSMNFLIGPLDQGETQTHYHSSLFVVMQRDSRNVTPRRFRGLGSLDQGENQTYYSSSLCMVMQRDSRNVTPRRFRRLSPLDQGETQTHYPSSLFMVLICRDIL